MTHTFAATPILDNDTLEPQAKLDLLKKFHETLSNQNFSLDLFAGDNQLLCYLVGQNSEASNCMLKQLLDEAGESSAKVNVDNVLVKCCNCNNVEALKTVLAWPQRARLDPKLLIKTATSGHVEVMRLLLTTTKLDPNYHGGYPLQTAVQFGQQAMVTFLLNDERVDPTLDGNLAVRFAVKHCSPLAILKQLLADSRVDPSAQGQEALRDAIAYKYDEIVTCLLADARVSIDEALVHATRPDVQIALRKLIAAKTPPATTATATSASGTHDVNINVNLHVYVHTDSPSS